MICMRMGYPAVDEEVEILKRRRNGNPIDAVEQILNAEYILMMQKEAADTYMHDAIYEYLARLAKRTREHELMAAGLSPRGTVALAAMSRARAWLQGRDYVLPEDAADVFLPVALHRIRLNIKAKAGHVQPEEVLMQIMEQEPKPSARKK